MGLASIWLVVGTKGLRCCFAEAHREEFPCVLGPEHKVLITGSALRRSLK